MRKLVDVLNFDLGRRLGFRASSAFERILWDAVAITLAMWLCQGVVVG